MSKRYNSKDIATGVLLITFSVIGLYLNRAYPLGSAGRMGPGYMPMIVLVLLGGLGVALVVTGLANGPDALEKWSLRELGLILASMILFGLFLERIGLALAITIAVAISSLADRSQTIKGALGCAAVLVVLCWLVFIVGLRINVPFLPPMLGSS